MSSLISKKKIAVIGDESFVRGFKLGGATVGYVVDDLKNYVLRDKVRKIMSQIYEDRSVGVVIVQDKLKDAVEGFRRASMYPLIIYLPSARTAGKMDVREYYASLIRSYLGISLEV